MHTLKYRRHYKENCGFYLLLYKKYDICVIFGEKNNYY